MADDNYKYYFRDFINQGKGTAFIEVRTSYHPHGGWDNSSFSGSVKLADCSRSIELEFYCNNEERRQKRLHKLNMIIDQLTKVRTDLENWQFVEADPSLKKRDNDSLDEELGINNG